MKNTIQKKMIKRLIALWIIVLSILLSGCSRAEGTSHISCDCGEDPCICFIQLGDEGQAVKAIVTRLISKGYLEANADKNVFSRKTEKAVRQFQEEHLLEQTGMMDDETLTYLLWDMSSEELDKSRPINPLNPSTFPDTVYIPTDGGKKRHSNPKCSNMLDPRKVSIRNAAELGFEACKKCEVQQELILHK